jgi:PAS domain S-box-containing protein
VSAFRSSGPLTATSSGQVADLSRLLEESEARFKALFSSTDEGYCFCEIIIGLEGRAVDFVFLEMNERFSEITGLRNLINRRAYELFRDLDRERLDAYERVALAGETIRYEKASETTDRWFEIVVLPVAPLGRFVVVVRDQTLAHEVELARRTSEDLFRTMAEDSPMLIWMLDADGGIEFVNPTFCSFLGVSLAELQQHRWTLITHPEDGHAYTEEMVRAVRERDRFHAEARTLRSDGLWRTVESWAQPRFGLDGAYLGHLGTSADVTERVEMQRQLDQMTEVARDRMELMSNVVTAIESVGGVKARAQRLLDQLIPRMADFGSVEAPYQADYVLAVAHKDASKLDLLRTLREQHRPGRDSANSMWRAADGEDQLIANIDVEERDFRVNDETRGLLGGLAALSHIAVPLDLGGGIRGALMLGISDIERPPFGPVDRSLAFDIAERAGVILAAARLQEAEHNIAIRLQQALLPNKLIEHDRVQLSARYEAAGALLKVGGDWYDSFTWPDGYVGVVVGDVVGHGIESAAAMGRLRSVLAALAPHLGPNPAALIDALAHFMEGPNGTDYATVSCAVLNTTTGQLRYASAGHPPMLVVADGKAPVWLDSAQSPPISALAGRPRSEASVEIGGGAVVIAYSDGLVERRGECIDVGLARLERTARRLVSIDVANVADHIVDTLVNGSSEDDVVVVTMRYLAAATSSADDSPAAANPHR